MDKKDILASFIIGEICALIFLLISRFLGLPAIALKIAKFFPIILPPLSISGVYFASLLGKKVPTIFQMGKNFLVGILNTFIDLGVLNLLMWLFSATSGWQYVVFKGVSFSCAVVNSYFWNKFWAFEKKETKASIKEFAPFFTIAVGGLAIHLTVAPFVVNVIGPQFGITAKIWANIGGIAAAFAGFLWNFFGYKLIVFRK